MISTGAEALLATALGEGDYTAFRVVLSHTVAMVVVAALLFPLLFLPFLTPLLRLLGATPSTIDQARAYAVVALCTQITYPMMMLVSVLLTLMERPLLVFGANLAAALLNAGIDALLLFGLKTDLWGAAVATGASGILVGSVMFVYFAARASRPPGAAADEAEAEAAEPTDATDASAEAAPRLLPSARLLVPPQLAVVGRIAALGVSTALVEAMFSLITTIANVHIKRLVPRAYPAARGYDAEAITTALIAAFGIGMRVQIFAFMPEVGVEQAALALLGFNLGLAKIRRVRAIFSFSVFYAFALCLALTVALVAAARPLMAFFGFEDPAGFDELPLELRGEFIISAAVSFTALTAPLYISGVVYQAKQHSVKAFFVLTAHSLLIVVPLVIVLPLVFPSIMAIALAYPIGSVIASIIGLFFMFRLRRTICAPAAESASESAVEASGA